MWIYVVLLFAVSEGVLGRNETLCGVDLFEACKEWFDNKPDFPVSEEDVLDICPKILSHVECVKNFLSECRGEGDRDVERFRKIKVYLNNVCKEDSLIRGGIVAELPCIKDAIEEPTDQCTISSKEAMKNYLREIDTDYKDSSYQMQYYCYYLSVRLACLADVFVNRCGARARDILVDGHLRTAYMDDACEKVNIEDLLKVVEVLQLEVAQKERISSVLRAYKEFEDEPEEPLIPRRNRRNARSQRSEGFKPRIGTLTLEDSDRCSTSYVEVCPGPSRVPIPGSSEELDELCSKVLVQLDCVQKYADKCWNKEDAENLQRDVKYAIDVCDKNSKTHQDVLPHLYCIKEVVMKTAHWCMNMTSDFIEDNKDNIFSKYPYEDKDGEGSGESFHEICLTSVHLMTCLLSFLEVNCDPGAVDVVMTAYHRTSVSKDLCGREIEDQLLKIVDILKTEMNTKTMVELLSNNFV